MRTTVDYRINVGNKVYIHNQRQIENRLRCIQGVRLRRPDTVNPIRLLAYAIMKAFGQLRFRVVFKNTNEAAAWMAQVRLENYLCRDRRFVCLFNNANRHMSAMHRGYVPYEMIGCEADALFIDEVDDNFSLQYGNDVNRMPVNIVIDGSQYNLIRESNRVRYVPCRAASATVMSNAPVFTRKPRAPAQNRGSFFRPTSQPISSVQNQPARGLGPNGRTLQQSNNISLVQNQPARGLGSNGRASQQTNNALLVQNQPARGLGNGRASQQTNNASLVQNQPARCLDGNTYTIRNRPR